MLKEMAAVLPKISMRAVKAEKLGQLRAGQKEGDAAFEARHHAFGNEIYNDACFDEPAMNAMNATSKAVPAASAPKRVVSPPAISPRDAPTSKRSQK
jgi:hypothetical protein